jgi:hypothetical protein
MQLQNLLLESFHPPEGAAHEHAAPFRTRQRLRRVPEPRVLERESRRRDREVREAIVALGVLRVREVLFGNEHRVRHLRTDLARVVRWIESRYRTEGRHPVDNVLEEILVTDAASADHAEARHHHPPLLGVQRRRRGGGGRPGGGRRRRSRRRRRGERADGGDADYDDGEFHNVCFGWGKLVGVLSGPNLSLSLSLSLSL